ncbi:hypothetical protein HanRHA438_Chr15g0733121 [Helianthus annuus]|nr:hypothetical protein HanRHA438_Chr15g0733121 [Helianthus annuus]
MDLGFFLSDLIGELELELVDLGLLDPSGLEMSDNFFKWKNLPLNTIVAGYHLGFHRRWVVGCCNLLQTCRWAGGGRMVAGRALVGGGKWQLM